MAGSRTPDHFADYRLWNPDRWLRDAARVRLPAASILHAALQDDRFEGFEAQVVWGRGCRCSSGSGARGRQDGHIRDRLSTGLDYALIDHIELWGIIVRAAKLRCQASHNA